MSTYDQIISRADAAPLIPTQESAEILKSMPQTSLALRLCRTMQMSTKTFVQPVLGSLPVAYWVNGDTGLKQTTDVTFRGLTMTAEELATIVVIPDALIADSGYPLWSEVRPLIAEAIGLKLDQAVFAGADKPATWPTGIIPGAIAAGNTEALDSTSAEGGVANDLVNVIDEVEMDGYNVTAIAGDRLLRSMLRKARDTTGQRLADVQSGQFEGIPLVDSGYNVFPPDVHAVAGDYTMAIIGVRQDLTYKMLDQAVITDDTGAVIINLPQQDSQAMRVVARFGFVVANPLTRTDQATPYPFAVLQDAVGP